MWAAQQGCCALLTWLAGQSEHLGKADMISPMCW